MLLGRYAAAATLPEERNVTATAPTLEKADPLAAGARPSEYGLGELSIEGDVSRTPLPLTVSFNSHLVPDSGEKMRTVA